MMSKNHKTMIIIILFIGIMVSMTCRANTLNKNNILLYCIFILNRSTTHTFILEETISK